MKRLGGQSAGGGKGVCVDGSAKASLGNLLTAFSGAPKRCYRGDYRGRRGELPQSVSRGLNGSTAMAKFELWEERGGKNVGQTGSSPGLQLPQTLS